MAEIIPFPGSHAPAHDPLPEIDLLTAIDVAIRDLRDIAARTSGETRRQAEDCRSLLERSYLAAVSSP